MRRLWYGIVTNVERFASFTALLISLWIGNDLIIYMSSSRGLCPLTVVHTILLMWLNTVKLYNHGGCNLCSMLVDKGASMCVGSVLCSRIPIPVIKCRGLRFGLLDLFWLISPGIDWWVRQRWWCVGGDREGSGIMCVHAILLLLFAHKKPSWKSKVNKHVISQKASFRLQPLHFKLTTNTRGNLLLCLNQWCLCAKPALVWCVCVCSGTGCVYLVRGVRQISWCVTGAIKVVALDTAHERHNDSGLMLISLRLAPSWGAGLFCCRAGLRASKQTETTQRGADGSSITPTGRGREAGQRVKEGRIEERKKGRNKERVCDHKGADLLSKTNAFNPQSFVFLSLSAPPSFT